MSLLRPSRRPEMPWRVIDDEAIVVHPRAGLVYPLNPVATRCWELADGSRTVDEIIMTIAEEFEAPRAQIARDVPQFLRELERKGLLASRDVAPTEVADGRMR